jgi:hypothetical protein
MADRGGANGTVQATGNGPGIISYLINSCLLFFVCLCYHNPKIDSPTYFRATTNSATELTAALSYSSAAASPSTPISSDQGAAAAEVNVCVSQACLRDLTGGSFFTDTPTADTNCAILPLHTAQLFPPLNISSREVPPVSSLRAGFNFGHLSEPTASLSYSSAAASSSTPISSSQGAAAAEVNACVSQACLRDLTGGSFFTDTPTADTNCAILPLHTAQLFPPLNRSSREVPPVSSLRAQEKSCGRPACRTNYRFDGFASYQCLCVIVLLFVWLNGITVNKIYSLDLLCSTAGLRFAKSVSPYATTIVFFCKSFREVLINAFSS